MTFEEQVKWIENTYPYNKEKQTYGESGVYIEVHHAFKTFTLGISENRIHGNDIFKLIDEMDKYANDTMNRLQVTVSTLARRISRLNTCSCVLDVEY